VSEPRRAAILDAACRVIARVGIDAARMRDVAEAAGVSTALVHYYYPTRDDLLEQAFIYADERASLAEARVADGQPPVQRIERMLAVYLDDESEIYESWILWREMWSHAIFDDRLRPELERSYRVWLDGLAAIVREGQAEGSIPPAVDPDAAVCRLSAFVEGLGPVILLGLLDRGRGATLVRDAVALELGVRVIA
jgi:AcrR family transcriptional regulator